MADNPITERQGDKIVELLREVVSVLNNIKSEVERLEGIDAELFKIRQRLVSIESDVGSIKNR